MRSAALVIFILSLFGASAQSYEQTLKQCLQNFHEGLGKFSKEQAETEIERRYSVLNECIKGKNFPEFRLHTMHGNTYTSEQTKGKVILLNFWFTKSTNSVALLPMLNEFTEQYDAKEFEILSFCPDGFAIVSAFLKEHPVKYKVFEKTGNLINHQFKAVLGYPTNIILNKKGEVVEYIVGANIKPAELKKLKERLVKIIEEELSK